MWSVEGLAQRNVTHLNAGDNRFLQSYRATSIYLEIF